MEKWFESNCWTKSGGLSKPEDLLLKIVKSQFFKVYPFSFSQKFLDVKPWVTQAESA